jgi:DNA-binding MarR family transcriptional regulator
MNLSSGTCIPAPKSEAESEVERFDLRPRHVIALTRLDLVGDQSQSDLAEALRVDRTNLVGLLNDLETADLIERRRSPQDRRRHTVSLTPEGTRRLAQVQNALAATEQRVLSALDAEQQATLHALLVTFRARFSPVRYLRFRSRVLTASRAVDTTLRHRRYGPRAAEAI